MSSRILQLVLGTAHKHDIRQQLLNCARSAAAMIKNRSSSRVLSEFLFGMPNGIRDAYWAVRVA